MTFDGQNARFGTGNVGFCTENVGFCIENVVVFSAQEDLGNG